MNLNGISNLAGLLFRPGAEPVRGGETARPGGAERGVALAEEPAVTFVRTPEPRAASDAGGAAAPEGMDPELWEILSADERAFFARAVQSGPLTYGPSRAGASTPSPALRGGRLDVRA